MVMLTVGIKLLQAQMSRQVLTEMMRSDRSCTASTQPSHASLAGQGLPGQVLAPFYVGLFIICQVLGIGGPTGFSVNTARDLGPRIAHFLLPIPNKGPSEWYYSWVPVTANFAGGAVGAALFMAMDYQIWP